MIDQMILNDRYNNPTNMKQIYENGVYMSTTTTAYTPIEHQIIKDISEKNLNGLGLDFSLRELRPKDGVDMFLNYTLEGFNEKVKPQIVIRNSYNSGNALKLFTGAFTLACSNGVIIGDKFSELKHIHKQELNQITFTNTIQNFITSYPQHLEFLNKLKEVQLTDTTAVEHLGKLNISDGERVKIFDLFANGSNTAPTNRRDDSLHCLYQSATEFFTHKQSDENTRLRKLGNINKNFQKMVA